MSEDSTSQRFIEKIFPVHTVSLHSEKEKFSHKGHLSSLHIWWARRPLASSRASIYAALIPGYISTEDNLHDDKNNKPTSTLQFIERLSDWRNALNSELLTKAREHIRTTYSGTRPKILDPFSGSGTIPFEALRLGCEVYALDYNPVAVFIEKCALDFPHRFKKKLKREVQKWAEKVFQQALKDLKQLYEIEINPKENLSEYDIYGFIWVRVIKCTNPRCKRKIPLMKHYFLSKKRKKRVFLHPHLKKNEVTFKIVAENKEKIGEDSKKTPSSECFIPEKGTISNSTVHCPSCHHIINRHELISLLKEKKYEEIPIIAIFRNKKVHARKKDIKYVLIERQASKEFLTVKKMLQEKRKFFQQQWKIDPIPTEEIPHYNGRSHMRVVAFGMQRFSDLFNERQLLSIITFIEKIRYAYLEMQQLHYDPALATAITSYLVCILDRVISFSTKLCWWEAQSESPYNTFGRQRLSMVWDYFELNPISEFPGAWQNATQIVLNFLEHTEMMDTTSAHVYHGSATELPFPEDYFDAVFTDPPYYDNIIYSDLADFFYVWLKRSVGYLYPDLFATTLSQRTKEIVADPLRHDNKKNAKKYFETQLRHAFHEIHRVLKKNGIAVVVYAYKTTDGWESLLSSLMQSGLTVTAAWPITTETKNRLVAQANKAAVLASSIYIILRKQEKKERGYYHAIKKELKTKLFTKVPMLWSHNIRGPDLFIAAIGFGLEVFSKYSVILNAKGRPLSAATFLKDIRIIITDLIFDFIGIRTKIEDLPAIARFYILWRHLYQNQALLFDDARKLAQSCGIDLESVGTNTFIIKNKNFIQVLEPTERNLEKIAPNRNIIDLYHYFLILAQDNETESLPMLFDQQPEKIQAHIMMIATALSQILPYSITERKLVDIFLLRIANRKKMHASICQ